jgi:hypothetical protein
VRDIDGFLAGRKTADRGWGWPSDEGLEETGEMMTLTARTLTDAIAELAAQGYTESLQIQGKTLIAAEAKTTLTPNEFTLDAAYRFDSDESGSDRQHLFAVSSARKDIKGLLVDAFDMHQQGRGDPLLKKLRTHVTSSIQNDDREHSKYGLPKVYKAQFDEDPDRYELRVGYPDFPTCPFDLAYSMLGFDKEAHRYVWLVTSIIKDKRLKRIIRNDQAS